MTVIKQLNYKQIPDTDLEIASIGDRGSRITSFRVINAVEPIEYGTHPRATYIGRPQRKIRDAMRNGNFSRLILEDLGIPISGNSFDHLRKSLDTYISK